ncbi:kinase-like domain-containing protein [Tanacetum coccineum]
MDTHPHPPHFQPPPLQVNFPEITSLVRNPIRAIPFHLSRATCRPGKVSPATSRPGYPGFVAGEYSKWPIPDAIGNLSMLTELSLQSNNLESHIPSSLGNCTKLIGIILSYNRLSGNITNSLGECICLAMLNLRGKIPEFLDKWNSLEFLNLSFNDFVGLPMQVHFQFWGTIGFVVARNATVNHLNLQGRKGSAGILDSEENRFVAVKIDTDLSEDSLYCHQSSTSSKSRSAQKFSSTIFGLRVYAQWKCTRLASLSANTLKLNLLQRISILRDVATALDYLHNRCQTTIIHGDLMPSNILLDADIVAHVGDFGLARLLEYGIGSDMTSSGDIYSFGISLLEVMTAKKPIDDMFNNGLSLHKFAYMALPDHAVDVIDGELVMQLCCKIRKRMQRKWKNVSLKPEYSFLGVYPQYVECFFRIDLHVS